MYFNKSNLVQVGECRVKGDSGGRGKEPMRNERFGLFELSVK